MHVDHNMHVIGWNMHVTCTVFSHRVVTISTLMQDSNIRLYDSLYSGGIPRLLQVQIACLMSTEHDEINVHVVVVQSQVIANIKINFIHVC